MFISKSETGLSKSLRPGHALPKIGLSLRLLFAVRGYRFDAETRKQLFAVKPDEVSLFRSNLMNIDVIESGIDEFLDPLQVIIQVRAQRHSFRRQLWTHQANYLFELTRQ